MKYQLSDAIRNFAPIPLQKSLKVEYRKVINDIFSDKSPSSPDFSNAENRDKPVHAMESSSALNVNKSVPVYKWDLKFSGTLDEDLSFNAFLERFDDLGRSRNINTNSASDVFEGYALNYRHQRHHHC
ncbi:hypothetical protein FQA39_LY13993 [Lamprigera yunnana]|nr:hypothetical protein FQA39_LY13993 [Lamprigera yunnana]